MAKNKRCPACGQTQHTPWWFSVAGAGIQTCIAYIYGGWAAVGYLWGISSLLATLYLLSPSHSESAHVWDVRITMARRALLAGIGKVEAELAEAENAKPEV